MNAHEALAALPPAPLQPGAQGTGGRGPRDQGPGLPCYDLFRERGLKQADLEQTEPTGESSSNPPAWLTAVRAAESKKATDIRVLDLRGITSFADYFVICTGGNARQIQAISDEVHKRLKEQGERPISLEGYSQAEWVLADYGDFLVHIFSPTARAYYDLERLWRNAKAVEIPAE